MVKKSTKLRKARAEREAKPFDQTTVPPEAPSDCTICPRLVTYRQNSEAEHPDWFNGAVPSFGSNNARLLIVGLAPGLQGANRTGRPFTGDFAGDLLYATLSEFGFSKGTYDKRSDDGLRLQDAIITNAVRCVPPQNKPTPDEIKNCRPFFVSRINATKKLRIILALGRIAHDQTLSAFGLRKASYPFAHGARHELSLREADGINAHELVLYDSFHCSRYNTNTGRLTPDMFRAVFADIKTELDGLN